MRNATETTKTAQEMPRRQHRTTRQQLTRDVSCLHRCAGLYNFVPWHSVHQQSSGLRFLLLPSRSSIFLLCSVVTKNLRLPFFFLQYSAHPCLQQDMTLKRVGPINRPFMGCQSLWGQDMASKIRSAIAKRHERRPVALAQW